MYIILFLSIVSYRCVYTLVPYDSCLIPVRTMFSYLKKQENQLFSLTLQWNMAVVKASIAYRYNVIYMMYGIRPFAVCRG